MFLYVDQVSLDRAEDVGSLQLDAVILVKSNHCRLFVINLHGHSSNFSWNFWNLTFEFVVLPQLILHVHNVLGIPVDTEFSIIPHL